jgi:hypothetical protein
MVQEVDGWAHGRIGDMFGDFPVRAVRASPRTSTKSSVRANFDYTVRRHCGCVYPLLRILTLDCVICLAVALFEQEDDPTELTFKASDVISVLSNENPGWWLASLRSRIGYIPSNYVSPV